MFLLDTNVISELRKLGTTRMDTHVEKWAKATQGKQTYLSTITILELERCVLLKERRNHVQGRLLRQWLEAHVLVLYESRIIPPSIKIAQRCALLHVLGPKHHYEALLAATALVHNLTLVTRNISDFKSTGVKLLNPWEYG